MRAIMCALALLWSFGDAYAEFRAGDILPYKIYVACGENLNLGLKAVQMTIGEVESSGASFEARRKISIQLPEGCDWKPFSGRILRVVHARLAKGLSGTYARISIVEAWPNDALRKGELQSVVIVLKEELTDKDL